MTDVPQKDQTASRPPPPPDHIKLMLDDLCASKVKIGGRYTLQRFISAGGGGYVYLATTPNDQKVAFKVLKIPRDRRDPKSIAKFEKRFKREFGIMCKLSHPNIAEIYDFGHHRLEKSYGPDVPESFYYFTMEFLPDGDLRSVIGELDPVLSERLLIEALRALAYLNNFGLLHLDIKPENFLLTNKPQAVTADGLTSASNEKNNISIKLIDFGLADLIHGGVPLGGTVSYMAPETIQKLFNAKPEKHKEHLKFLPKVPLPDPDHRTDIYSLGLAFYKVLARRAPFKGLMPDDVMVSHLLADPKSESENKVVILRPSELNPSIPPYLDDVIMRMIQYHPDDRYQNALEAIESISIRSAGYHPPSQETYYSYIPTYVGRDNIRSKIETTIKNITQGVDGAKPIICIVGTHGMGKSTTLRELKPFTQQNDFFTFEIDANSIFEDAGVKTASLETRFDEILGKDHSAIFIDDLDCLVRSDKGLIEDINRVISKIASKSLSFKSVLIATIDPVRADVQELKQKLQLKDEYVEFINLPPFSTEDIKAFLEYLFGTQPTDEYVKNILQVTDGNPKVLNDIFYHAIKSGRLFGADRRPSLDILSNLGFDFSHIKPPNSLIELISAQYKKLSPMAQFMTILIASAGTEVSISDLIKFLKWLKKNAFVAAGFTPASLDTGTSAKGGSANSRKVRDYKEHNTIFDELRSSPLFSPADMNKFVFANSITCQIVTNMIPKKDSEFIHSIIARYLEKKGKKRASIDYHLARGCDKIKAIKALKHLAEFSSKECMPNMALFYLKSLNSLIPKTDSSARVEIAIKSSEEYSQISRYDIGIDLLNKYKKTGLTWLEIAKIHLQLSWLWAKSRETTPSRKRVNLAIKGLLKSFPALKALVAAGFMPALLPTKTQASAKGGSGNSETPASLETQAKACAYQYLFPLYPRDFQQFGSRGLQPAYLKPHIQ